MASSAYVARDRTISVDVFVDFFEKVEEYLTKAKAIEAEEKAKNEPLMYQYQEWTHNAVSAKMNYSAFFVDGSNIQYKSVSELKTQILHQAVAIRSLYVDYSLLYFQKSGGKASDEMTKNHIYFKANENGFKLEYDIDSLDEELDKICMDFTDTIDKMPLKLDRTIKQKDFIMMKVGLSLSTIVTAFLAGACIFIPPVADFFHKMFWIYPVVVLAVAFLLGAFIGNWKLGSAYNKLIPKKYGGYDTRTHSSYKVDDMETFCEEVDVLMGKKSDLGSVRKYIADTEKRFSKFLLPGLGALAAVILIALLVFHPWA